MDINSFLYKIGTEHFHEGVEKYLETKFDTNGHSNDDNRPISIGTNIKVIIMMKDELGGKIVTKIVALRFMLRVKIYVYRKIDKKLQGKCYKGTNKYVVAETFTFDDYRPACLTVKKYTQRKCCLEITKTRCT